MSVVQWLVAGGNKVLTFQLACHRDHSYRESPPDRRRGGVDHAGLMVGRSWTMAIFPLQ